MGAPFFMAYLTKAQEIQPAFEECFKNLPQRLFLILLLHPDPRQEQEGAHDQPDKERVDRELYHRRREECGRCTSEHGKDGPASLHMPRPENSERQGQEDPAAAKRHGNVRPEKHLTPAIQDGDEAGQKHDEKHGQLIHRQHLPVIGHAAERHDHIACDHRTDAEREPADTADQRQDDAAHGQTSEERMHLIDEVGRKHHDRLYIRIQSLHIEADRDRRQTNGNDDGCR